MTIPVALASEDPRQPFVFRSPGSARPDAWTDGRAGTRQRDAGLAEIAGVHLRLPVPLPAGDALEALQFARLKNLIERIYTNVPFYRTKLDQMGVPTILVRLKQGRLVSVAKGARGHGFIPTVLLDPLRLWRKNNPSNGSAPLFA